MQSLDVEDGAQVHAAFLVYMDLTEGESDQPAQSPSQLS
jgi:hypothetical protein